MENTSLAALGNNIKAIHPSFLVFVPSPFPQLLPPQNPAPPQIIHQAVPHVLPLQPSRATMELPSAHSGYQSRQGCWQMVAAVFVVPKKIIQLLG